MRGYELCQLLGNAIPTRPFSDAYSKLCQLFKAKDRIVRISENICSKDNWPSAPGVYLILEITPEERLVYIGMTGKIKGDGSFNTTHNH